MNLFQNKSGCELTYLSASLATALAQGLTCDEIAILASILVSVGDNLALLAIKCIDKKTKTNL